MARTTAIGAVLAGWASTPSTKNRSIATADRTTEAAARNPATASVAVNVDFRC